MIVRKCVQCGKEFTIKDTEIKFYKGKNLNLPKRCKECRENNKKNNCKDEHREESKQIEIDKREEDKKVNKGKNGFWKILIAAIVVITGLFEGWVNLNNQQDPNKQQDSKNSSIESSGAYTFKSDNDLIEHFEKHGNEFKYTNESQYLDGANKVINSPDVLHKSEKEDGDDVYYLEKTNEFVIVSTSGYIRTYFKPQDGIAYYNRQ